MNLRSVVDTPYTESVSFLRFDFLSFRDQNQKPVELRRSSHRLATERDVKSILAARSEWHGMGRVTGWDGCEFESLRTSLSSCWSAFKVIPGERRICSRVAEFAGTAATRARTWSSLF